MDSDILDVSCVVGGGVQNFSFMFRRGSPSIIIMIIHALLVLSLSLLSYLPITNNIMLWLYSTTNSNLNSHSLIPVRVPN